MRYLTIEQRESLLNRLQDRADVLYEEVRASLHQTEGTGLPNRRRETDDDAVAELESTLDVTSVVRDALELHEVEKAIRRLRTPDFGSCVDCGTDIPYTRLIAQPTALRCVSCQEKFERTHSAPSPQAL